MNPEIKTKWLDALRSGDYEQGYGTLHRTYKSGAKETFCCLGVLTHLALADGVKLNVVEITQPGSTSSTSKYDGSVAWLPPKVQDWAGLDDHNPRVGVATLSTRNDEGATFDQIADLIEEHL